MKIVLVNPSSLFVQALFIKQFGFQLGLGYIAAYLRQYGHEVMIFDPESCLMPLDLMWKKAGDFKPDMVGITSVTPNFMSARQFSMEAKKRLGCLVVMGGPHVTALPQSTLQSVPEIDAVIRGEGEIPMLALAAYFDVHRKVDFSKIPGAAFMDRGVYREIPRPEPVSDLDRLPYPARDLVDMDSSYRNHQSHRGEKSMTLISSRGCPSQCTFCANTCMGRKFRAHSPYYVVSEMAYLTKKYGVRHFRIVDDCFTADPNRVSEICGLIIDGNLNITWDALGRVNTLRDEALVLKMKRAGCLYMGLGIETGSQRINDLIKKGTTLPMAEECCFLLRKHGIPYYASFIIGNEGDTRETVMATIAFAKKIKSVTAIFNMLVPYPGTPLFDKYYKDYDKADTNWNGWSSLTLSQPYEYRQTILSKKAVWWLTAWAYFRFYFDPFQLLRTVLFAMKIE